MWQSGAVGVAEVVDDGRGAGQSIEHPPLCWRADVLQHVDQVMVKTGEGRAVLQGNIHPVPHALQRRVLIASEQGGVGQQTPGRHHT